MFQLPVTVLGDWLKLIFSLSFAVAGCWWLSVKKTPYPLVIGIFIHSTLDSTGLPASTCRSRARGSTSAPSSATSTLSTSRASVCPATSSTGTRPLNCKFYWIASRCCHWNFSTDAAMYNVTRGSPSICFTRLGSYILRVSGFRTEWRRRKFCGGRWKRRRGRFRSVWAVS